MLNTEDYGKVFVHYMSDIMNGENVRFINLLHGNEYDNPNLFDELKSGFLLSPNVNPDWKNVINNLILKHKNYQFMSYVDLELYIDHIASNNISKTTFYIFGTSSLPEATYKFHKMIKESKYDIVIKHI